MAPPRLTLNNGVEMPALGLGVYMVSPEETARVVEAAIRRGYRLIDTAAVYSNERQVGEGIRRSGVDRSEIFVTTKLWLSDYGYAAALRAFETSLRKLGFDYVDLYLLHWPFPNSFGATVASYQLMEQLVARGHVRAIGVSNFTSQHLNNLLSRTDVVPAVNQVEIHPYFAQQELRAANARRGVITQSWSPIGGVYTWRRSTHREQVKTPLQDTVILEIASRHTKTPAQIIVRWHIEHQLCPIPKSVRPDRLAANIDIFDFSLSPAEISAMDALDTGVRAGSDPAIVGATVASVDGGDRD